MDFRFNSPVIKREYINQVPFRDRLLLLFFLRRPQNQPRTMENLISREGLYHLVTQKIEWIIIEEISDYAYERLSRSGLWARYEDNFYEDLVSIFFLKMIIVIGDNQLEELLTRGHPLHHSTLRHNLNTIFPVIYEWAWTKIQPGTSAEWNAAIDGAVLPEMFQDVNL